MSANAIEVKGLIRRFDKKKAIDGFGFSVPKGSITGLLGPNGAGKTTTIHILLGLLSRHHGEIDVLGYDPKYDDVKIRERAGFVPEDPRPEPRFTIRQQLNFFRAFRPNWDMELEGELLERFELDPKWKTIILSRGQRAKLALISALAFRPELLILDDPTSGLDPLARREFIEGILGVLSSEGKTVLFSTHHMDDIERIGDRIVMIYQGKYLYEASLEEIKSKWRCYKVVFEREVAPGSLNFPGMLNWKPDARSGRVIFNNYSEESLVDMERSGIIFEPGPLSLEDIYVELVQSARESAK